MPTLARIAVAIAALGLTAGAALAQTATLDARPPTISTAPWDQAVEARAVLVNTGDQAIVSASLAVFSNDGIAVVVEPASAPRLKKSDSFAWKLSIDLSKARVPGTVELDATFTIDGETPARHVFQQLKFEANSNANVDKPIDVTLSGSFDTINDARPGRGYLMIGNNLDVEAKITDIRVQTSDPASFGAAANFNVSGNASAPFSSFTVPARSSQSQFIELTASPSVASGKHHVVLAVDAEWTRHGRVNKRTWLVGKDVTLGVFFESEILRAISVPSFLLLPGALFLLTIDVLLKFKWGGDNKPTQWPKLEPTSAEFWVIAVTWSGVFAFLYTFVGVDILIRYGAKDLRNVWLLNIAVGVAVYAAMVQYNKHKNKNRPADDDDELKTLEKLAARSLAIRQKMVSFTHKGETLQAFDIGESATADKTWVVPPINATFKADTEALAFKTQLTGQLSKGSVSSVLATLQAAKEKEFVTVQWAIAGSVQDPMEVAVSELTDVGVQPMVVVP